MTMLSCYRNACLVNDSFHLPRATSIYTPISSQTVWTADCGVRSAGVDVWYESGSNLHFLGLVIHRAQDTSHKS